MSKHYKPVPETKVPRHTLDAHREGEPSNPPSGRLWCWQTWEGGRNAFYWIRNSAGQWFKAKEVIA